MALIGPIRCDSVTLRHGWTVDGTGPRRCPKAWCPPWHSLAPDLVAVGPAVAPSPWRRLTWSRAARQVASARQPHSRASRGGLTRPSALDVGRQGTSPRHL